ncbi:serine hydrolase domain-containing protein [Arcicella aquatica]|uniref:Serine hydrolase domain-containing protein n=1 Tax=Arcicella aquatica TaxID=217141 RepID=A0ABU5QRX8_9BACT|nr:serine hydrolase domain-containing protein [Arcicella aquatica]MEA5259510.1 serine hydrolase domain-containing protein [Arcicella aquatica]
MKKYYLLFVISTISLLGYGQEKIKIIDSYIKEIIKINKIPGLALGIVKNDKIVYEKYYGLENLEDNKKVDKNSKFRVYSTTKLISNVSVFQLIEKGKLSLEDNVSKYLENLPLEWQNVKIENLLSHSSGIPDFVRYEDVSGNIKNEQMINRLSKEKMEFETGNEFRYNQTNY